MEEPQKASSKEKRKASARQPEVVEDEQKLETEANEQYQTQNAGSSSRSFLKKKKNQTVIQAKVTWKVESRIDCWGKDKSAKSGSKQPNIRSPRGV